MKAKLLPTAVLLAIVMQAGFSLPAMARISELSEPHAQAGSINAHVACWYLGESEYDIELAFEEWACENILLLSMLPVDIDHLHLTQLEYKVLEGDLWLVMEDALHPYEPPPSSSPASNYSVSSVEDWRGLVAAHFPAAEVDTALCVMAEESGGNASANNPKSTATGLMQILASLWGPYFGVTQEELYDPETNMAIARKVWDIQGWGAWNAYWRCS